MNYKEWIDRYYENLYGTWLDSNRLKSFDNFCLEMWEIRENEYNDYV